MYINVQKKNDLIKVKDDFIAIDEVTDDAVTGTIKYSCNQVNLIKSEIGGAIVRITLSTKNRKILKKPETLGTGLPALKVQTDFRDEMVTSKLVEASKITELRSDSTSKVNNQLIQPIKAGVSPKLLTDLFTRKLVVKTVEEANSAGGFVPILQASGSFAGSFDDFESKKVLKSNLVSRGVDPSQAVSAKVPMVTSTTARQGTSSEFSGGFPDFGSSVVFLDDPKRASARDALRYFMANPLEGVSSSEDFESQRKILVLENTFSAQTTVKKDFSFAISNIRNKDGTYKTIYVLFEVLDTKGVSIQSLERTMDFSRILEVFHAAVVPPSVFIYRNDKSLFGSLRVQQNDPYAKAMRLYRRRISHTQNMMEDYLMYDEFEMDSSEGEKIVPIEIPAASTIVYRAIPVSDTGVLSSEFTNIVVASRVQHRVLKHASLSYKITGRGIEMEVREISRDAISFSIVRKDKTLHDSSYTFVTDNPILVEGEQTYQIVDSLLKTKHVYEYAVKLNLRDGRSWITGNIIVEYVPFADGLADTRITNFAISFSPDPDVKFDLETNISSTNIETLTKLIKQADLVDFFSEEILNERSKLNDLICYSIERQDLTSGQIENFGIISEKSFSDSKFRVVNSVSPLRSKHQYRYIVTTLLRAPETLFEDFVKTATDSISNRQYSYKPFKFRQPFTLERGVLTTAKTLNLNHAKEPFAFGNVGSYASVDAFFDKNTASITDVKAEIVFGKFIFVRWKYNGFLGDVDHFVIMKEFQGARVPFGKSHALSGNKQLSYQKVITPEDLGENEFVIVPVFSDYQIGDEVRSNKLLIEDV